MSIFGNAYNTVSLTESLIPISLGDSEEGVVPSISDPEERQFIPRNMLRHHMSDSWEIKTAFKMMSALNDQFKDKTRFCLATPPPISDPEHIKKYLHIYQNNETEKIPPKDFRLACYQIQIELYLEHCEKIGLPLILPPENALDKDGLLMEKYWPEDPTHANEAYGRLVIDQILERL